MPTPELKRLAGLVKAVSLDDAGPGSLEGYANVFGIVDSYGDVTMPGAFAQDISDFISKGYLLPDHEWEITKAIGTITEASEDGTGLYFKAQFHSDPKSQEVRLKIRERIEQGKEVGLSIGYWVEEAETGEQDGKSVRFLKRLRVKEVSVVVAQANDPSVVTDAKSQKFDEQYRSVTEGFDDLISRVKEINDLGRGEAWKQARIAELMDLGSKAHQLADSLKPEEEPTEPPDLSEERRQVALHLCRLAGVTVERP